MSMSGVTSVSTTGLMSVPFGPSIAPSPVSREAPLAAASLTSAETRCAPRLLIRGPTMVAGSVGSPTGSALTRSTYLGTNASTRFLWMMIRSVHMQICPEFMNAPKTEASRARSRSASSRMISGFFPPSSSTAGLRCWAAWTPMMRPTLVEPVKFTIRTRGSAIRAATTSPASARSLVTTLRTPGGSPASASTSARRSPHVIGASSLGFITTVLPTASGMAIDRIPRTSGAFHGEIAPTTPKGTRWAIE